MRLHITIASLKPNKVRVVIFSIMQKWSKWNTKLLNYFFSGTWNTHFVTNDSRLTWFFYSSFICSASCSGWMPPVSPGREAAHPVLQMWGTMQRRGAASPDQPLPHKVLYVQRWAPLIMLILNLEQMHLWSVLRSHVNQNRLHTLSTKLRDGFPVGPLGRNLKAIQ